MLRQLPAIMAERGMKVVLMFLGDSVALQIPSKQSRQIDRSACARPARGPRLC